MLMYRADTGGTPEHTQVVTPEVFSTGSHSGAAEQLRARCESGSSPEASVPGTRLESGETEGAWGTEGNPDTC